MGLNSKLALSLLLTGVLAWPLGACATTSSEADHPAVKASTPLLACTSLRQFQIQLSFPLGESETTRLVPQIVGGLTPEVRSNERVTYLDVIMPTPEDDEPSSLEAGPDVVGARIKAIVAVLETLPEWLRGRVNADNTADQGTLGPDAALLIATIAPDRSGEAGANGQSKGCG